MRSFILLLTASIFIISCNNQANKEKEALQQLNDSLKKALEQSAKPADTAHKATADSTAKKDTTSAARTPAPGAKVMTMTFEGYDEGDYPHVLFKEISTGTEYDFRHIDENNTDGIPILLDDAKASFGLKANKQLLKKKFIVEVEKKKVKDMDLDGSPMTIKDWVINHLQQVQ